MALYIQSTKDEISGEYNLDPTRESNAPDAAYRHVHVKYEKYYSSSSYYFMAANLTRKKVERRGPFSYLVNAGKSAKHENTLTSLA